MNETIDLSLVYAKTPKGVAEISTRSGAISLQTRRVLIMIDGRRPVAELVAVVRTGEFENIIGTLEGQGMIEKVDAAALPARGFEEEDFADTISLLQENAAALRSMPFVNAATVAQATHPAGAPVARAANPAVVAPAQPAVASATGVIASATATEPTAPAARAAPASSPRPAEPAPRRPPTLNGAAPATLSENVAAVRHGTLSGTARVPDPTMRPATLTGQRAAPAARPTAPPERTEQPPPAPAPAAAAPPPRSLEEEKRSAVSELYSVLGPYGEQPAGKIQECTNIESLQEQIRNASRRIATFRGEKAAEDYLRAIGHA